MHKLTAALLAVAVICALAVPAGALAAKPVKYVGKTDAGHKVTFQLKANKKIVHFVDGSPHPVPPDPGKLRNVYEFLVPKYPIGTFVIYSCLGENTFKAKPARR